MAGLQQAGFLGQLASWFFTKEVKVHVRTQTLESGQVEVTPVFTIDGYEVPNELLGPEKYQTVLGYSVQLDQASQHVHKHTKARSLRLAKKKAGEFLAGLEKSGVFLRSKDGRIQPRVHDVKPSVTLNLKPNDSLAVESELLTPDGVVVPKPSNLEQLRADDGWYSVGDDLFRVATTGSTIDESLVEYGGNSTLSGDEVPRFLKLLDEHGAGIGDIEKNEALQPLAVFGKTRENRAKVDGDAESITVSPSLVIRSPIGREYEQTSDELETFAQRGRGFRRVEEGWFEVSPELLDEHKAACDELRNRLGDLVEIRGPGIPNALSSLAGATRRDGDWSTPWSVYFSKSVKDSHRLIDVPAQVEFRLNIVESNGRSLLELDPIYNHERFRVSQGETEAATESGEEWIRRRDAWVKVDGNKYRQINQSVRVLGLERSENGYVFPASQREKVVELFSILGTIQHSDAYAGFLAKLADFEKIEDVALPSTLRSGIAFRPYQKHGYNWLAFLHKFGLNGILADDMGLGKTLQTLAVIYRAREFTNTHFPSLIICPTSVVANWRSEIQKFFKDCFVIMYTGGKRDAQLRRIQEIVAQSQSGLASPIVITSYDIARLDHGELNRIPWLYVVVDEGHNIKNPDAQRTKAIKTINGQHKLALTGTPIQNNLEELWSLFDFAMPGMLGSRTQFREQYGKNGRVNWDAVHSSDRPLKDRIHPFILRRLKEQVAKDLPRKIAVSRVVELTSIQVSLYKHVIESAEYRKLVEEVNEKGVRRSSPLILAAYTKLRAICNHPALASESRARTSVKYVDSGKLNALKEVMEEIIDGEHRALLFSQSTQMLDIIGHFFDEWGIQTLRLDGSTPMNQRSSLVDEFNTTQAINCFLISTKAGGTGLNLTGADTVIFFDHDWNPANDNQAQDRAHRIGQTKPVTVYKLVSKGTIEEKIIERQAIKQSLADQIIGEDEEGFKDLSKNELLALFTLDEPIDLET